MRWFRFLVEEGPGFYLINCISPILHVLIGTGKTTTQKLSILRRACDTKEVME